MTMLAEHVEVVIGVDTHRDTHTAAVVVAATGAAVDHATVCAAPAGYEELFADGRSVLAVACVVDRRDGQLRPSD